MEESGLHYEMRYAAILAESASRYSLRIHSLIAQLRPTTHTSHVGKGNAMKKTIGLESPAMRRSTGYFSPERLTTFKLIFDTVCDELAIPRKAIVERELLATTIMVTGRTVESEMILITTAMEAIAGHRQKVSSPATKSTDNTVLEMRRGLRSEIHTEH